MEFKLLFFSFVFTKLIGCNFNFLVDYNITSTLIEKENLKIYKAERNGVFYAIKHYNPAFVHNNRELLQKEIEFSKHLSHPNIIRFIEEISFEDDQIYMIYELGDIILQDYEFTSMDELKKCIRDILLGVYHMQKQGILHNDLKCDNIVKVGDTFKIIDFGNAMIYDPNMNYDFYFLEGVPYEHVPPEIRAGQQLNYKSDVYSIGKILKYLYDYKISDFEKVLHEEDLKDLQEFLEKITSESVENRFTIEEALLSPWFKSILQKIPNFSYFSDIELDNDAYYIQKSGVVLFIHIKDENDKIKILIKNKGDSFGNFSNNYSVEIYINEVLIDFGLLNDLQISFINEAIAIVEKGNSSDWESITFKEDEMKELRALTSPENSAICV